MNTKKSLMLAAVGATLFFGCVNTGGVKVIQPLEKGKLSSYSSASVNVEHRDPSATNAAQHVDTLRDALVSDLQGASLFSSVDSGNDGDLAIKVVILNVDGGNSAALAMSSGGDASVLVNVEIVDQKAGTPIGKFDATGNSKTNSSTSVGGVNLKATSDQRLTALKVAAEHIVEHLKERG